MHLDEIVIEILDENGRMVAQGERYIREGRLAYGQFAVAGPAFRDTLTGHFNEAIAEKLSSALSMPKTDLICRPSFSRDGKTLLGFDIFSRTRGLLFTAKASGSSRYELERHAGFKVNNFNSWLSGSFPKIFRQFLQSQEVRNTTEALNNYIDTIDQGIGSAVHKKFFEIVPHGTSLELFSSNLQTVDFLSRIFREAFNKDREVLPANQRVEFAKKEVLKRVSESLWGRLLIRIGWQPVEVMEYKLEDHFQILFIKP